MARDDRAERAASQRAAVDALTRRSNPPEALDASSRRLVLLRQLDFPRPIAGSRSQIGLLAAPAPSQQRQHDARDAKAHDHPDNVH